jgi:hypothetical protein
MRPTQGANERFLGVGSSVPSPPKNVRGNRLSLWVFLAQSALGALLFHGSQNRLLIGKNRFLIRENLPQRALVFLDHCLIGKDSLLIFQNRRLMAKDLLLVPDNYLV